MKLKYKTISIKMHRMRNVKFFVIPVIVEVTEIVTKGLRVSEKYQKIIQ